MKLIIAGSRNFNDYDTLDKETTRFIEFICNEFDKKVDTIISGGAKGADTLGERYAKEHKLNILKMPAEWDKYGKSAGYKRNVSMAKEAEAVICFWDGQSKGTKHMIDIGQEHNLIVRVIKGDTI
jgi:hypothetical protein